MKGLKYLIKEMMSGRLTFYFKAVPMKQKGRVNYHVFIDKLDEALPCFIVQDFNNSNTISSVVYNQLYAGYSRDYYQNKHLYRGLYINCLCVLYEPEDVNDVTEMDRYLLKLLRKMANKAQLPVFLIYGYPVFESDYLYMIRYISQDGKTVTISYINEDEYKLYLKLLLDIDSDAFVFTEFNSISYDKGYKFYSFHRKDDLS